MPRSNSPERPSSGSGSSPAAAATSDCSDPCTQREYRPTEVRERASQTISNAPAEQSQWNGSFGWPVRFSLHVNRPGCQVIVTVKIKVVGTVTDAQKSAWRSANESKWNNRAKLMCPDPECPAACTNGYLVSIRQQYVSSGEHVRVTANIPGATAGGRAGLGGTTSMTGWGVNDTVDITHEFGHMLGNVDEYFTTNGVDYTQGGARRGFRDSDGSVMNNPSNNPESRHYELIRREAADVLGVSCTLRTLRA